MGIGKEQQRSFHSAGARVCSERGQMTVEFLIAFPVMIIVAVISLNAVLFFSECAAFDRLARQAICTYAAAPSYGGGCSQIIGDVQEDLQLAFDRDYLDVSVSSSGGALGYVTYTATLNFTPTLVGRNFSGAVFGVSIPPLKHEVSLVVDPYKPGAII